MDIFHQEQNGLNPLRGFFSPYTRNNIPPCSLRYVTLYGCLLLFWFFQSPTAETPEWILTLKTSNDAVLRKEVPFECYKNEISYLIEFQEKFGKITIISMGKSLNCHNSGCIIDRVINVGSVVYYSGSAN